MEKVLDQFNIERTPTLVILDSKKECQVTLVGCTFQDIEALIQIRSRIAQGLPKGIATVPYDIL